jgi:GTP-binding protein
MKVLGVEFLKSCATSAQYPRDILPELACVGRSNVGKSSLINALLNRKALAKVSSTPGKTRLVNYFVVETDDPALRRFYLVDLPGYGYAKVPKSLREQWGPLMEGYFAERSLLRSVLFLVDVRVARPQDVLTYQWLLEVGRQPIVVVTKIDKLSRSERSRSLAALRAHLQLTDSDPMIACSSVTREGTEELWRAIRRALATEHRLGLA